MNQSLKSGKPVFFAWKAYLKNSLSVKFSQKVKLSAIQFVPLQEKGKECIKTAKKIIIFADGKKLSDQFGTFLKKASNSNFPPSL